MSKLMWDAIGEKTYETGLSKGVLYNQVNGAYPKGVVWNGLINVNEAPGGAEPNDLWADDIKYASLRSAETYGCTIEAYTYPDEFGKCDGSEEPVTGVKLNQQNRESFGFSYVTKKGNDQNPEAGYVIHLVYGASANPSEKSRNTMNETPEAVTMSWEVTTIPVPVDGFKPVSTLEIDSTKVDAEKLKAFEAIIWGSDDKEAMLPLPDAVLTHFGYTKPASAA